MPTPEPLKSLQDMADPLFEAKAMIGLPGEPQAVRAITHALVKIRADAVVGYRLGLGTETFALLTEALAALTGKPVRDVREHFLPENPVRVDEGDGERLSWLQGRFLEMPSAYTDLLGFPRRWCDLRDAIDDARATGGNADGC